MGFGLGGGRAASPRALASEHDVALLDLDGVVYVGRGAVPHAAESLERALAQHGMRAAFVTNNAARPPAEVAAHLVELGVRASPADVVTSAQSGARMLAERVPPGSRVLAVGGPGVAAALQERGLVPVTSVDDAPVALMQGYGRDVGWRQLAEASLAIERGLLWVATNLDRTIPTPRGRVLGNGSMVAALRHATGAEPLVAGKPEPPLMLESVERTGAARPLVVGDRLDTDIEGATRSGIPSLLVLTGVTDWTELLTAGPQHRPTYVDRDLRGLLVEQPEVVVDQDGDRFTGRCRGAEVRVRAVPAAHAGRAGGASGDRSPGEGVGADVGRAVSADAGRGVSADAGRGVAMAGAVGVDALAWLPEVARVPAEGEPGPAELDLARALIGVAWAAADSGRAVVAGDVVSAR